MDQTTKELKRTTTPDGKTIVYRVYRDERDLHTAAALIAQELSEPYSIFTYRYFLVGWPQLCIVAHDADTSELVGVIIAKAETHQSKSDPSHSTVRGYIAMLAVHKDYRRHGIGSTLAHLDIHAMAHTCDEVVLETEITNAGALRLYENLGFVRDKRLPKYYLNGNDAYRLKLWLK